MSQQTEPREIPGNPFATPTPLASGILITWMYRRWQAENGREQPAKPLKRRTPAKVASR